MKIRFTYFLFTVIIFFLFVCCRNIQLINGTYSGKQDSHVFVFSTDSTFKYEHHAMWYSESFGIWRNIGNSIYLNSINQIDKLPIEYSKVANKTDSSSVININVNSQGKPQKDYVCLPIINGDIAHFFYAMERGSYSIESDVSIDSIYFNVTKQPFVLRGTGYKMGYDDVKTETIYPHLSLGENIDITIDIIDSLFGYKVFKNEELKIKGSNLIYKVGDKSYKLHLKK